MIKTDQNSEHVKLNYACSYGGFATLSGNKWLQTKQ